MRTLFTILVITTAAALHAQFNVSSGYIAGGYTDLTQKTDVSGGSAGPMGDDTASAAITPAGFSFPMYGTHFTSLCIADNGYIVLGNGSTQSTYVTAAPDFYSAAGPVISPMWADFDPYGNGYGYGQYGQIGWHWDNGLLTVEWKYLERKQTGSTQTWPAPGARMQATLDCTSGVIEMRYGDPDPECWGKNANWNNACSVGLYSGVTPGVDTPAITATGRVFNYPFERYVRFMPTSLPLHIANTPTLPAGTSGQPYSCQFSAVSGTTPYTWGASGLPSGWNVSTTGLLAAQAGATIPGVAYFTVTVSDTAGATHSLECNVPINRGPAYIVTPLNLPTGYAQTAYGCQFAGLGGMTPYSWAATGLPTGWSLGTTGLLSAAAQDVAFGTFSFDVELTDFDNPPSITSDTFTVVIAPQSIQITTTSVGPFTAGAPFQVTLFAQGGGGTLSWAGVAMPAGWSLNSQTGELAAAPQYVVTGAQTLTVEVSDQAAQTVQGTWTVNVIPTGALTITTGPNLPGASPRTAIGQQFNATGGIAPYAWSATGLPAGWSMAAGGQLTAAAADVVPGTYLFTASVADSAVPANTTDKGCTLIVMPWPALMVSPGSLQDGLIGQVYAESLSVNGGTGSGYVWTMVAGTLPPGLTAATGSGSAMGFSGTPTSSGVFSFSVSITDDGGNVLVQPLSITVSAQSLTGPGGGGSNGGGGGCASGRAATLPLALLALAPLLARRRRKT